MNTFKTIILLITVGLITSCGPKIQIKTDTLKSDNNWDFKIIVIDGCEYVLKGYSSGAAFAHKGNCNNPIHPVSVNIEGETR